MNLRTGAHSRRDLFFSLGTCETLSDTGLVIEISPDAHWGPGAHSLAIGGPFQMAGAALLLSGRKRGRHWVSSSATLLLAASLAICPKFSTPMLARMRLPACRRGLSCTGFTMSGRASRSLMRVARNLNHCTTTAGKRPAILPSDTSYRVA